MNLFHLLLCPLPHILFVWDPIVTGGKGHSGVMFPPPPLPQCFPLVCTKHFFKNMISVKKRSRHFHASITPKIGFYLQDCSSWLTALYKRWQITSQS